MSIYVHVPDWLPMAGAPVHRLIEVRGRAAPDGEERTHLVVWSASAWRTRTGQQIIPTAWRNP
jgi:hypothetical protein